MARGRRSAAVLLLAALGLVAACSTPERIGGPSASSSASAPRQDATLQGRVLGATGSPLVGSSISVVRTNTGFQAGRVLEAAVTFGLSCVASPADCPFRTAKVVDTAVTDGAGHYALTLPSAYLPGYETDDDWIASVGRAPTPQEVVGPSSRYELEVDAKVQAAPDLVLWDVDPTVTTTPDGVTVALPALQGAAGDSTVVRFATAAGAPVWTVHGPVDPRVLEDGPLRVLASGHADVTVHHPEGRTIYHEDLNTAAVPYQGKAVPLSRGKPCTLAATPAVGCPLTDGDLTTSTTHEAGPVATVDLGAPTSLGLVVVRASDSASTLTVDASTDGTSWRSLRLGSLGGAPGAVATPSGTSARYLRVTAGGGGSISELSAWPPTASEHALGGGSGDDGSNLLVRGVAALLVVAVGVAVLSRLRRWRRRAS